MAHPEPEAVEAPPASRWNRARAGLERAAVWVKEHFIALGIAAALSLFPVVIGAYLIHRHPPEVEQEPAITLEMALAALDAGDLDEAQSLAQAMQSQGTRSGEAGGPAYVLGVVAELRADELIGDRQAFYHQLAARRLEESRGLGFPSGREPMGLYLLGKNLLLAGRTKDSIPVLEAAKPLNSTRNLEVLRLLIQAYIADDSPDPRPALPYLDELLADSTLDAGERYEALLEQARVQFRIGDRQTCRETLSKIPADTQFGPAAAMIEARILLQEARVMAAEPPPEDDTTHAREVARRYREILGLLKQAQGRAPLTATAREAMYLSGICLQELHEDQEALAQFQKTTRLHGESLEGIAANYAAARLLLSEQKIEPALRALIAALDAAGPPEKYHSDWLPLETLREAVMSLYRRLMDAADFAAATELTDHLAPVFSGEQVAQLQGETHRAAARRLLAEADRLGGASESLRDQAAEELRQAGDAFARLAELRFEFRDFPDQVWASAEAFLEGRDFRQAAAMYREYLNHEVRRRRPAALLGLGESLLEISEWHESLAVLKECVERYPQDGASFRARLLASKIRFELGELKTAEELLLENLQGDYLTPASREWRDSLFALGWLLHYQGRWSEAITRLEEAVERYPDVPAAIEARYLTAHAYGESARAAQQKYQQAAADSDRLAHGQEMQRLLRQALERYDASIIWLVQRQESGDLGALEQRILRNSYFGKGAALSDLGRHDEAILVYSTAANRYHLSPAALEAYLRIAACYRRLNRGAEFRGTLERAKIVLKRLPDDAPYTTVTSYNRQQWGDLLDWLGAL